MTSEYSLVYLVTGANRGLGLSLVLRILEEHSTAFVYAGTRAPEESHALKDLEERYPGRISRVQCISADAESNAGMAAEIAERHGRIDTVIANAGIWQTMARVEDVEAAAMAEHYRVNVLGPTVLFQAVRELLRCSAQPRFVPMSTVVGCIAGVMVTLPVGSVAYGASKAALNWVTRKIHFEEEWLVSFPLSPRPIDTDMFKYTLVADTSGWFAKWTSANAAAPSVDAVAKAVLHIIDNSTREKDGGQFRHSEGKEIPW